MTTQTRVLSPQSPVVEPLTDVEWRARVLEAAALEIEVRGWTKGEGECGQSGAVCLLGAIAHASGHPGWAKGDGQDWLACARYFGNVEYVGEWTSGDAADALYGWNDGRGRTVDEVTFLLRWRAQELRDGWDAA